MEYKKPYFSGFDDIDDMLSKFDLYDDDKKSEIKKLQIIFAIYDQDENGYDGNCLILFIKDGKLYEVNEYHCSCHGFESWIPDETTKEAMLKRHQVNNNQELIRLINSI